MHDHGHRYCPGHANREGLMDEAIGAILSSVDLQVVLQRTARLMRRFFGLTRLTIHRWTPEDPDHAEVLLVDDPRVQVPEVGTRVALDLSACGPAIREKRTHVLEPLDPDHPRFREERPLALEGYGALVSIPLVFEDQVIGTLDVAHVRDHGLLQCCLQSAERIAGLLAIAMHNSRMVEEVRRLNRLLEGENARLKARIQEEARHALYVAESPRMRQVLEQVRRVAPSRATVLIRGETGTGKEGLARMVHAYSPRARGPFVTVNLGAIPESLIESELFGHERGAFTGASRRHPGRFVEADGGTIFLDEIGDAPMSVQVKLLRALQERQVQSLGGQGTTPVDVRVVAATNRPLETLVEVGAFRADLFYRLHIVPIYVPPLRERPEDIRPLVQAFLERHASAMNRRPPRVPDAVWQALEAHTWPGNVRELENLIERALILHPGPELVLPGPLAPGLGEAAPAGAAVASPASLGTWEEEARRVLTRALEACGGRIHGPRGAAAMLGLKPTTLQGKLRRYGIPRPRRN
ncbi:MAG TPA: sigma 54-interacting transcriptional regulator [Myxococcota bacterium]|nr:sigma 54-interacting transcriptional regulator [Myxococcota bacterium]HQK51424.1 sigma 54-interacting transcriptional regulator [Myxococcota bacterium]